MNLFQILKESARLEENYRTLAKYGMGTETSKSARVGLEMDFYDEKGNKQFGKILRKTNDGYLVKDDKGKKHVFKYHDRVKAKKMLKPNYVHTEETVAENNDINEKLDLVLTVKGDKNVAHALKVMKKFKGISVKRQGKVKSGQVAVFGGDEKQLQKMQSSLAGKIRGLDMVSTHEETQLDEVTDKEINAMRKVSKDMQKVLVSYQKIANMGDKELKNTKHNFEYKQVLQARDTILSMIGKLQTRQTIEKSMKREELEEAKLNVKKQEKLVDLFNKLMDVKHNGPEFKKIKKEIDKLQREWVESDGSKRRVKEGDKRKNVMDSYREMWEQGQKYAPKQELPEQDLQEIAVPRKEFEKIKKGNTVSVEFDSSMKKGHKMDLLVKSITRSNKYNVDKINMVAKNDPRNKTKFTFYSRGGKDATLAWGDMATVLTKYKVSR